MIDGALPRKKFSVHVPIVATLALLATMVGWIANASNLVSDVSQNKKDIDSFKQYIIENSEHVSRIDERTEMIKESNDRIEKYLIGRGK